LTEPDLKTGISAYNGAVLAGRRQVIRSLPVREYNDSVALGKMNLLEATQFNNAYINALITDLVQNHVNGGSISQEGEYLAGRCIRLFDPCLSCATH